MSRKILKFGFLLCLLELSNFVFCTDRRVEDLDGNGKYIIAWEIEKGKISFEATVETKGFVGFGISTHGGMTGADIVMGGVFPNGTTYFQDYHATGNTFPTADEHQDWVLDNASENDTHTVMRFSRLLQTCDPHGQDIPIETDTLKMIWSYGNSDYIDYHLGKRGSFAVEFLDPPSPVVKSSEFEVWNIVSNKIMPSNSTTYWCSVHEAPDFGNKTHVVGFNVRLDSEEAKNHLQHIVVWMCTAPNNTDPDTYFEKYLQNEGDCYGEQRHKDKKIPLMECREIFYVWAVGGKPQFLPEHVGYPLGEKKSDYVLLEVHYNNPNELSNVSFPTQVDIYHTSKLRKHDAGVLMVDHKLTSTHMIPPKSEAFVLVGHCSSECIKEEIPEEGIYLFNVLLHSHLAGKKLKLRHFRGNQELPWVANENNYAFDFQQNRQLGKEVQVLPGDHLSYECTYGTMDRDNVTLGGFSTEDEMCESFIWYYPNRKFINCGSRYQSDTFNKIFGIDNLTNSWFGKGTVTAPESLANLTFVEVVNTAFTWTPEIRTDLQDRFRNGDHIPTCWGSSITGIPGISNSNVTKAKKTTTYPKIEKEYKPESKCPRSN